MNIAALASGGVDSSIALTLLKEQGFDPVAFYLKVWMEDDIGFGECPWQEDVDYVCKITDQFGLKMEIVPMQKPYWEKVVDYTIREVKKGLTPNPDVMCNKLVKFGAFYDYIGHDFDKIATGHYAKTETDNRGKAHLLTCKDLKKDQTYFLCQMSYDQISSSLFPLGDYTKSEVRNLALQFKLPNATRKDSQGICFLGKINFRDFLTRYVGQKKGPIIEKETGKILGQHKGFWFYTIGQRNGLGLGLGPWYVVEKETSENIIYVSHGPDPNTLYKDKITLSHFNWINHPNPFKKTVSDSLPGNPNLTDELPIQFKIRHIPLFSDGILCRQDGNSWVIIPEKSISAVARGQFAAIYYNDECLGGGIIC